MSEKRKSARQDGKPADESRRDFMRAAALGAGLSAMAGGAARAATPDMASRPISRPEPFEKIKDAPVEAFAFPTNGAAIFAEACKQEGLGALFCCPGNYNIISAIAAAGIPAFGGRGEGPMCSAADAFIRVSGEIAAASGTEGPGFTNMICAIAAANSCRTPLLVLASNMTLRGDDTERGLQRGYQQATTEGIKKYGKRVIQKERVHEYAGYAFRQLKSGTPGPVHLDFVEEAVGTRSSQIADATELDSYWGRNQYRTESRPHPDPKDIDRVIDLIKQSSRPLIVASMGVFYSKAWEPLKAFAEKAQIPVVDGGPMRGHFSDGHELSASTAPDAMYSVDLAILVGQYCMPGLGEYPFDVACKYIRIDPNPHDIGRNIPIDVGIVSCEKAALQALADKCPSMTHDAWVAEVKAAREAFEKENDEHYALGKSYTDAVHPAVIATELAKFLHEGNIPRDQTTIVSGGFGIGRYTRRRLRAYRPGQICNGAYQYGSIGPDVGYLLGVGVAKDLGAGVQKPYQGGPVVGVTGDAGFGYSGFEIDTLAKYKIPGIIIVYNNNAWGTWSGYAGQPRAGHMHLFQENLRYDKVAEALGGYGEYVTSPDQFTPALERCWKIAVDERKPSVINCQAKKEFWNQRQFAPGMLGKVEPGVMAYNH